MANDGIRFKVQHLKNDTVFSSLETAKESIVSLTNVIDSELVTSRYIAADGKIKSVIGIRHMGLSDQDGWTMYSYDDDLMDSTIEELKKMIGNGGGDVNLSGYYTKTEVDDKVAFIKTEKSGATMSECTSTGDYAVAEGRYTSATTQSEHASGQYNISLSGSSDFGVSGNTLFTVGNGSSSSSTHNTLQIMQNGDIYIADTLTEDGEYYEKPMVKLQGKLKELELPKDGLIDQVLTLTSDGIAWKDAPVKDTQPVVPTDSFWSRGTSGEGAKTGLAIKDRGSTVTGNFAFSDGYNSSATTTLAYASGQGTLSQNKLEVSFGQFNNSSQSSATNFGEAGNTLFTLGNGYNYTKKWPHNAFEVRQNGDIYFPDVVEGLEYYEYAMRRLQDIPKVWKGTWEEYSKLDKLDDNTLYYIYESSLKNMYPESDLNDFGSYVSTKPSNTEFELLKQE